MKKQLLSTGLLALLLLGAGCQAPWQRSQRVAMTGSVSATSPATGVSVSDPSQTRFVTLTGALFPDVVSTLSLTMNDRGVDGHYVEEQTRRIGTVYGVGTSTTSSIFHISMMDDDTGLQTAYVTGTWAADGTELRATVQRGTEAQRDVVLKVREGALPLIAHSQAEEWHPNEQEGCLFRVTYPEIGATPLLSSEVRDRMNNAIRLHVGLTATTTVDMQHQIFMEGCKQELAEIRAEYGTSTGFEFMNGQRAYELNTRITYNQGHHLGLAFALYTYTGGAHGSYQPYSLNFDTRTGEALSFQDLAPKDQLVNLKQVIDERVMARYEQELFQDIAESLQKQIDQPHATSSQEALGLFAKSANFHLTPVGIDVFYQQYELAPYAAGILEVFLSRDELKSRGYATTIYE